MATTQLLPNALPGRAYGSFAGRGFATGVDTTRTALHEQVGNSVVVSIAADYRLRLPYGYGGARLYLLTPTAAGLVVTLPRADYCSLGGIPSATVVNRGAFDLVVLSYEGDFVATILAGNAASFRLLVSSVEGRVWYAKPLGVAAVGSTLADRVPVDVRLSESTNVPFDLRARALALGYAANVAYAVRCTIAAGVVQGSNSTATPAFSSGLWPAGTTLAIVLEAGAWITGAGGKGGRGGDVPPGLLAGVGAAGGHGLRLDVSATLVSAGTIQGGGGGGGAGAYASTTPGAGGGGGAGYSGGPGGASGNPTGGTTGYPGGAGNPGGIASAGSGGVTPASSGGYGGLPGVAGAAASAAGGAAGAAIRKHGGAILTKIRAGTINGAEVIV